MEIIVQGIQGNGQSLIEEQKTFLEEDGPVTRILMSSEVEVGSRVKCMAGTFANRKECMSLV